MQDKSVIASILSEVAELSENFIFRFVPREANIVAHVCDRFVCSHACGVVWRSMCPNFLVAAVYEDCNSTHTTPPPPKKNKNHIVRLSLGIRDCGH